MLASVDTAGLLKLLVVKTPKTSMNHKEHLEILKDAVSEEHGSSWLLTKNTHQFVDK